MPQGDLAYASITVGVWIRMLLEYLDTILLVNPIEVIPEDDSGAGRPRSSWEGASSLANVPGKDKLIDLGEMFVLDYRQYVSVDIWLVNM